MSVVASLNALSLVYSTSLLYAGFLGLGALWATSNYGRGGGGLGHGQGYGRGYGGHHGHKGGIIIGLPKRPYGKKHHGYGGVGYTHHGGGGGYHGYKRSDDDPGLEVENVDLYLPGIDNLEPAIVKKSVSTENFISNNAPIGHLVSSESTHFALTSISDTAEDKNNEINSRRIRRDTSNSWNPILGLDVDQNSVDPSKIWIYKREPEEERILKDIRKSDTNNCGMRLICEISAVKDRELTPLEWEIVKFVRNGDELFNRVYPGEGVKSDSAVLSEYQDAARLGSAGQPCEQIYRSCRVSAGLMLGMISGFMRV